MQKGSSKELMMSEIRQFGLWQRDIPIHPKIQGYRVWFRSNFSLHIAHTYSLQNVLKNLQWQWSGYRNDNH